KVEGRVRALASVEPSARARAWARRFRKDARVIELVLQETKRVVRMQRGVIIAETRHGFVCANAGVDVSNAPPDSAILLPRDPDLSARLLRRQFGSRLGARPAVLISDSFGRPWREGLVNVALGVAGIPALRDYRGRRDRSGRRLEATQMATADALAAAAELVMGKALGIPAALIRGVTVRGRASNGRALLRPRCRDLFR
ncbi:MAG: coenzyme F420-0:L-glutamate ligase, partial [Terriglobales bacterium]